ncbi:Transmembrane protein 192 [Frankliniella fusca]|uniref:Transmembrane protein 192 n=1 Tax=Frankliniella fusca TaxID=407009 RepID=A0AAE1LUD8_9NEOP|nr:Transmembrane protein 192 [Frankliniella fusca]
MVSLSRNANTSAGGAVFFNDGLINGDDDEVERLQPLHGADEVPGFRKLHTFVPVILKICVIVLIQVAIIALLCLNAEFRYKCEPFYLLVYIHAAYWCLSWILHQHLKLKHRMLRINGYLEFYKQTESHIRIPFYIISLWNAILLVITSVYHHIYSDLEQRCKAETVSLSPNNVIGALMTLETGILIPVLMTYLVKVRRFNETRPPPDVQREDWMMSFVQNSFPGGEVGYREPNEHIHDLLAKQADLIRYLKEYNAVLLHKLIQLSSRSHIEPECT